MIWLCILISFIKLYIHKIDLIYWKVPSLKKKRQGVTIKVVYELFLTNLLHTESETLPLDKQLGFVFG